MNLADWMRHNLSLEVVTDNENPELGIRLREMLAALMDAAEVQGPERTVLAISQPQARWVLELLAAAWAEGYQDACDDTPLGFSPGGPTDERNPFVSSKPDDAIDDQRHRHLLPEAFCEWCGEVDLLGRHDNGCRLGLGPDELHEVNYECPRCFTIARWTDGRAVDVGDERNEFWCQTCGTESPLEDCRVVPR